MGADQAILRRLPQPDYLRIGRISCPSCGLPLASHSPRLVSTVQRERYSGKVFETEETAFVVLSPKSRTPCTWRIVLKAYQRVDKDEIDRQNWLFMEALSYFIDRLKEAKTVSDAVVRAQK